ncbi:MAG TPA: acyl carrier protein [Bdellovibrionota bacterium]|nr:acyl carrier protein [Bdellovibrionota bacterium]
MNRDRKHILQRLNQIFIEVFDDFAINLSERTTAADIDGWDSIMHISLVVTIEKEFGLRLNAAEVGRLQDVGAMIDILVERATK